MELILKNCHYQLNFYLDLFIDFEWLQKSSKYHKCSKISIIFRPFEIQREITSRREQLLKLHLEETDIRGLPASIELLSGLVLLNLKDCKNLEILPSTINGLRSLRKLYLSGCSKIKNVTENLGKVESLEVRLSCYSRAKK